MRALREFPPRFRLSHDRLFWERFLVAPLLWRSFLHLSQTRTSSIGKNLLVIRHREHQWFSARVSTFHLARDETACVDQHDSLAGNAPILAVELVLPDRKTFGCDKRPHPLTIRAVMVELRGVLHMTSCSRWHFSHRNIFAI